MKYSKLILAMGLFTAFIYLASCSKKSNPKPVSPSGVTGYWFGTANGGAFNQSFLLRANGSLKVYDFYANPTSTDTTQAYVGSGTYIVKDNFITVNTGFNNGQTFSATAQIDLKVTPPTLTFGNAASGYNGDVYRKQ